MADEKQRHTWVLRTEIVDRAIEYVEAFTRYLQPDQHDFSIDLAIGHLKARQALVEAVQAYKEQRDG